MVEIISIRFKNGGKEYYFNPNGLQFQVGDGVIVETTRGTEFAQCVRSNNMIDEIELTAPLRPVVRKATPEDARLLEKNKEREKSAFSVCQQKIAGYELSLRFRAVSVQFIHLCVPVKSDRPRNVYFWFFHSLYAALVQSVLNPLKPALAGILNMAVLFLPPKPHDQADQSVPVCALGRRNNQTLLTADLLQAEHGHFL